MSDELKAAQKEAEHYFKRLEEVNAKALHMQEDFAQADRYSQIKAWAVDRAIQILSASKMAYEVQDVTELSDKLYAYSTEPQASAFSKHAQEDFSSPKKEAA